jgi:hypothetical protein
MEFLLGWPQRMFPRKPPLKTPSRLYRPMPVCTHAHAHTYAHTQFPVGYVGGEERDVSLSPSLFSLYSSSALSPWLSINTLSQMSIEKV